ncbi:AAA family ATPase [Mesorhizobium sp. M0018]|uniref:AAA family ATPase n=1 Tax=Mesorhizobium sp. M0018 TaxID=2956844 RepID=UPI003334B1BD
MSLWWTGKDQLDDTQRALIEDLPLRENHMILGPPGCGKTNVLLRRAQFLRSQSMPGVMVLSFTRPLVEFVKTGCYDGRREIFPPSLIMTVEGWIRSLYRSHKVALPVRGPNDSLALWKRTLAGGALGFSTNSLVPKFDAILVDEGQDLYLEELQLVKEWADVVFFVGDSRQKIYRDSDGLGAVEATFPGMTVKTLKFHYRLAPELCRVADRILNSQSGETLSSTSLYKGPKPGHAETHGPLGKGSQIAAVIDKLKTQTRVYSTLIEQGDKLGVIVPRGQDRQAVFDAFEADAELSGLSQIIRARSIDLSDSNFDPSFDPDRPISIVTEAGSKGLEFRAVHWLFCDDLRHIRQTETYYTVITRPKTSMDAYFDGTLPQSLAASCAPSDKELW